MSGSIKVSYRAPWSGSKAFRTRRRLARPALHALQMRQVARIKNKRAEILKTKVYDRSGNPNLTGNLKDSEKSRPLGNFATELYNSAEYADQRDKATGPSVLYGHDKELHFNRGGVEESRAENKADARATMHSLMRTGG
jgi:hypothetical protein